MQFKEVALIGTDGNYVKFSPIVEGVEGASRTILVSESNEEIKVEDDQTVFTSVKNTVTIVAPVLDADIATLNGWVTNDTPVGFAGYTIGGVVYAPSMNGEDNTFELTVPNGGNTAIDAIRGDVFQVSQIQRVSDIKHTWRIVLTQVCLQGRNATTALIYGLQPNTNMLDACTVGKRIGGTRSVQTSIPFGGYLQGAAAFQDNTTFTPTGSAFNMVVNNNATGNALGTFFFPFFSRNLLIEATGRGVNGTNSILGTILASDFSPVTDDGFTLTTDASPAYASAIIPSLGETSTVYVQLKLEKTATGATGTMRLDDIRLTIV